MEYFAQSFSMSFNICQDAPQASTNLFWAVIDAGSKPCVETIWEDLLSSLQFSLDTDKLMIMKPMINLFLCAFQSLQGGGLLNLYVGTVNHSL